MGRPGDMVDGLAAYWRDNGWDKAASGAEVTMELFLAHRRLTLRIDQSLRHLDMNLARYELLFALGHGPGDGLTVSDLADQLQVHPTSVSSLVTQMLRLTCIDRHHHPDDRRRILVSLSASGAEKLEAATQVLGLQVYADLGIGEPDVQCLWHVLRSLRLSAGDFVPDLARRRSA